LSTLQKNQGGLGHTPRISPIRVDWAKPVNEAVERIRREQLRLAQEETLSYRQERDAERQLADRLIDIGFKALAKELHPDRIHGDKEAMQRLIRVRDKLKHSIWRKKKANERTTSSGYSTPANAPMARRGKEEKSRRSLGQNTSSTGALKVDYAKPEQIQQRRFGR
jgi:hypothetical protein